MSHFTTIQTQVRDLEALRDACAELGLELVATPPARPASGGSERTSPRVGSPNPEPLNPLKP